MKFGIQKQKHCRMHSEWRAQHRDSGGPRTSRFGRRFQTQSSARWRRNRWTTSRWRPSGRRRSARASGRRTHRNHCIGCGSRWAPFRLPHSTAWAFVLPQRLPRPRSSPSPRKSALMRPRGNTGPARCPRGRAVPLPSLWQCRAADLSVVTLLSCRYCLKVRYNSSDQLNLANTVFKNISCDVNFSH